MLDEKLFKIAFGLCGKVVVPGHYRGGFSEMLSEASLCPMPSGSKMDSVLARVKAIRDGGSASAIT